MTDTNLSVFDFNSNEVRVVLIDGEPWFIAKDVCNVLEIINVSQAVEKLDEDEKLIYTLDISGQNRDMAIISESGMYSLVLTSRKPEAKAFKKWLTSEVLPAIRKTGSYSVEEPPLPVLKQHTAVEYIEAAKHLSELDGRFPAAIIQMLRDRFGNELLTGQQSNPKALPSVRWVGAVQKAEEMSYKVPVKARAALGKFIKAQGLTSTNKEERLCNGQMRSIYVYQDTAALEQALNIYFTR